MRHRAKFRFYILRFRLENAYSRPKIGILLEKGELGHRYNTMLPGPRLTIANQPNSVQLVPLPQLTSGSVQ